MKRLQSGPKLAANTLSIAKAKLANSSEQMVVALGRNHEIHPGRGLTADYAGNRTHKLPLNRTPLSPDIKAWGMPQVEVTSDINAKSPGKQQQTAIQSSDRIKDETRWAKQGDKKLLYQA